MTPFSDLLVCLRFFSRLPVPATARERALGSGGLAAAAVMAPLAGFVLAALAAAVLLGAGGLRMPSHVAAALAVTAAVAVTGALHEDALADCADGFGGGHTRERKLAIMRDSRVGAYGAAAVALALILRTSALAAATASDRGATALLVAGILSRAACLLPLAMLPPARNDGAGSATRVRPGRFVAAASVAVVCTVIVSWLSATGLGRGFAAMALAILSALGVSGLAWRHIRGQTGDVAGATQQVVEIIVLLVFATGAT